MVAPHHRTAAAVLLRSGIAACFLAVVDLAGQAAAADMAEAQAAIAAGKYRAAAAALQPMVEAGDAQAEYQLAKLALDGHDVGLTPDQAMSLLIQAAAQGNGRAQAYLGLAYAKGRHVTQNDLAAYQWLSRASISPDLSDSERIMVTTNRAVLLSRLAPTLATGTKAEHAVDDLRMPAPEPATKPTTGSTKPAQTGPESGSSGFLIQLASLPSESAAQAESQRLQQKFVAALAGLTIHLQAVDLGSKGIYHRVQAGPFDNRTQARSRCAQFKAAKQDCIVVAARS